jgi:hypothetical protein
LTRDDRLMRGDRQGEEQGGIQDSACRTNDDAVYCYILVRTGSGEIEHRTRDRHEVEKTRDEHESERDMRQRDNGVRAPIVHCTIGGDTSLRHQEPRSWIARYRWVSAVIIGDKEMGTYRGCSHADRHARRCWTVARIGIVTVAPSYARARGAER